MKEPTGADTLFFVFMKTYTVFRLHFLFCIPLGAFGMSMPQPACEVVGQFQESVLPLHHVGPEDRSQVIRLGNKRLPIEPSNGSSSRVLKSMTPQGSFYFLLAFWTGWGPQVMVKITKLEKQLWLPGGQEDLGVHVPPPQP